MAFKESAMWSPMAIPIVVEGNELVSEIRLPASLSIPFRQGRLYLPCQACVTPSGQTENSDGVEGNTETQALAYWPDGSVRWLLVHFHLRKMAAGNSECMLHLNPVDKAKDASNGAESDAALEKLATDHLEIRWNSEGVRFSLAEQAGIVSGRLILTDTQSQQHTVSFDAARLESAGPVVSTIVLNGKFSSLGSSQAPLACRLRLHCYEGSGLVKMQITLHNPRRAAHHGGLWDLGDEGSVFFRSWDLRLNLDQAAEEAGDCVAWQAETRSEKVKFGSECEIYQDSSGGENWHSPVHVNRSGRVPCQFRGYRITHEGQQTAGLRATPVIGVKGSKVRLAVTVEEFWQQFPLSISGSPQGVHIGLFPVQWSDQFELQGGEQKTFNVWLDVAHQHNEESGLDSAIPRLFDTAHNPVGVRCLPNWYAENCAMPELLSSPASALDAICKQILEEAISGQQSLFEKRETIDEFGWRNFGDVWADHEQVYYDGQGLVVSHYNNQFDMIAGGIRQYLQTGNIKWWSFVRSLVRHVLDIDLYRTERDRAAYNRGLFWFTDHYYSAATATHRTFSRQNAPRTSSEADKAGDYGGGPGSEHNFATGLLYYYWITGDKDAAEGVRMLADWVLAMDDGTQTIWGMFDSDATGLASMSGCLEYQGPGRGPANSIQVLLDGWLLSREQKYLDKCESLIRRVIHPQDDVTARDLLNAEQRWSYTMFLAALLRYLSVKVEEGQLDAAYAYAHDSLLLYVRWMANHERAYLDEPEQLEFPTEAWAAQDLRKANVMRLAAKVLKPLSGAEVNQLKDRGEKIAQRAWQDLKKFETRQTTRAVAIVMTEGTIDGYLRAVSEMPKLPVPDQKYDYGKPSNFIPQKVRLRNSIRTLPGVLRILATPFRPMAWRILLRQIRKGN